MLAFKTRVDLCTKGNSSGSSVNTVSHDRDGGPSHSGQGSHGGRGPSSPAQRGEHGGFHRGCINADSRNNSGGTASKRPMCVKSASRLVTLKVMCLTLDMLQQLP
jgi:hypothetical protein